MVSAGGYCNRSGIPLWFDGVSTGVSGGGAFGLDGVRTTPSTRVPSMAGAGGYCNRSDISLWFGGVSVGVSESGAFGLNCVRTSSARCSGLW